MTDNPISNSSDLYIGQSGRGDEYTGLIDEVKIFSGVVETFDSDGDTVGNLVDNCPSISHIAQLDFDLDGLGDVCDDDIDNDGFSDDDEENGNLIVHWAMNESSNPFLLEDSSVSELNASTDESARTALGVAPGLPDGSMGWGLDLNGIREYAVIGDKPSLDFDDGDDFTISLWIKTSMTAHGMILSKYESAGIGYYISINPYSFHCTNGGGRIRVLLRGADGATLRQCGITIVNDDQWHHIVVKKINPFANSSITELLVEVDGISQASSGNATSSAAINMSNSSPLYIGQYLGGTYYEGQVDEVKMFGSNMPW